MAQQSEDESAYSAPSHAYLRFYAELNDHLPHNQQCKTIEKSFFVSGTVKDTIESFGVPHTEVDLIVVNGESVDFSYTIHDGDRIAVYPMFESIDITPALHLRPQPLRNPKFVLDVHLGKLAGYLRMLGFDSLYESCLTDPELVRISSSEHRTLLTRDRGLLKHAAVTHGYWLRATGSRRQIAEIVDRFDLARSIRPFTRCMACNGLLQAVSSEQARHSVPPGIAERRDEFHQCEKCRRFYWKGSHYDRMQRWIRELSAGVKTS